MTIRDVFKVIKSIDSVHATYDHGVKEYRVNFIGGTEATAYYTEDAEDAVSTARAMSTYLKAKL